MVNYTSHMGWKIGWLVFVSLSCWASDRAPQSAVPTITSAPAGPYHVRRNQILDKYGNEYLIRGTRLPPITANTFASSANATFGTFSGTTLITLRQRMNMNAVRLEVQAQEYEANGRYRALVKQIVQRANQLQLLAIIGLHPKTPPSAEILASFWGHVGAEFKANPNVFYALASADDSRHAVDCIRSSGASQPIIVPLAKGAIEDPNIVYEISSSYQSIKADQRQFDLMSGRMPLLADGLDPQLDQAGPECAAFPSDPGTASALIEDLLNYFDQRSISWTISSAEPGKLIDSFGGYDWSKLDDGWTCGESPSYSGIGMVLLAHLWSINAHGVITVNQPGGGLVIARGSNASSYGRTLAQRELSATGPATKLGDISMRVRDSKGIARLAPVLWTGAGWSSLNLVIPAESAPGPAEVTVVRSDGSETASKIIIANVAPALWTATNDGRGPGIAQVVQHFPDGKTTQFPAWSCAKGCQTVPIPLSSRVSTTLRLEGTGFRLASSKATLRVMIDGVPIPVESFGPLESTRDQVTIKLPDQLIGHGEADVLLVADGALSNVVRINFGR